MLFDLKNKEGVNYFSDKTNVLLDKCYGLSSCRSKNQQEDTTSDILAITK